VKSDRELSGSAPLRVAGDRGARTTSARRYPCWSPLIRGAAAGSLLICACAIGAGCASAPILATYTQADLEAICDRNGGWWRGRDLIRGFCEYQGPQP
jgi:hypothetical protein